MTKIIQGNFGPKAAGLAKGYSAPKPKEAPEGQENLLPSQEAQELGRVGVKGPVEGIPEQVAKAMGILQASVEGHMSFVIIGIKPDPTGADFYTAIHGDPSDLRNAQDHLPDVISRLYARAKLT